MSCFAKRKRNKKEGMRLKNWLEELAFLAVNYIYAIMRCNKRNPAANVCSEIAESILKIFPSWTVVQNAARCNIRYPKMAMAPFWKTHIFQSASAWYYFVIVRYSPLSSALKMSNLDEIMHFGKLEALSPGKSRFVKHSNIHNVKQKGVCKLLKKPSENGFNWKKNRHCIYFDSPTISVGVSISDWIKKKFCNNFRNPRPRFLILMLFSRSMQF